MPRGAPHRLGRLPKGHRGTEVCRSQPSARFAPVLWATVAGGRCHFSDKTCGLNRLPHCAVRIPALSQGKLATTCRFGRVWSISGNESVPHGASLLWYLGPTPWDAPTAVCAEGSKRPLYSHKFRKGGYKRVAGTGWVQTLTRCRRRHRLPPLLFAVFSLSPRLLLPAAARASRPSALQARYCPHPAWACRCGPPCRPAHRCQRSSPADKWTGDEQESNTGCVFLSINAKHVGIWAHRRSQPAIRWRLPPLIHGPACRHLPRSPHTPHPGASPHLLLVQLGLLSGLLLQVNRWLLAAPHLQVQGGTHVTQLHARYASTCTKQGPRWKGAPIATHRTTNQRMPP